VSGDPPIDEEEGADPQGPDRREYFRLPRSSRVTHAQLDFSPGSTPSTAGTMHDLSARGLRFESDREYPVGALLKLALDLPGWEKEKVDFFKSDPGEALQPLVVLAEVRWVKPAGDRFEIGALFINIDEWHHKALIKYLDKLSDPDEAN
jgi:hypothetical protein